MIKHFIISFFIVCSTLNVYAKQTKLSLKVDGMICISCETKVANVLDSLKGIKTYSIDTESDIVKITYNNKKSSQDAIVSAVSKLGYKTSLIN